MLTVRALAKINLTLEVLGNRPDGFHEVRSVIQTISLADVLCFGLSESVSISADLGGWLAERSLVAKAAEMLRELAGGDTPGVVIEVEKHIPLMSGLGGDSSDAAATLRALNELWKLDLPPEELVSVARKLGSDVAFFLHRGTALAEGRGEIITPLPPLPRWWVVVVLPAVAREPGKTARMYASLAPGQYSDGHITGRLAEALSKGEFYPTLLYNVFDEVADGLWPEVRDCRALMLELGAPNVHLAGSGPALFSLFEERSHAGGLCVRLRERGARAFLTEASAVEG